MKTIISLIAAVACATAAIGCKKEEDPHAHHKMEAGKLSGASLYQFHDMFTDQNGKQMMLHQLQGKYVVVAMFYATCTAICPRIAAEMLRLEKSLSARQRANTRFLMISFDHERDNPANLRKFIEKMRLTDSFVLLTGKPEPIREVAAALGVNYKKQPAAEPGTSNYEYAHSSVFSLLSPQGEIVLQHAGLSVSVENFREKIRDY
ncbi:SCO family protein [Turneriella parva]|uniref:Electron transport protein SCO1/SenC n=1 Tax=Turneriella parva (strain ATCC BAA-1111 / DSM 21527 / NCTC 11395 / H) TaxID=869212 RepID=I4B636_TURPD|nr:SCO family protein [Turneriella parva]AFM12743.1 electron transport protein SCO1/SenC [Turneriella parva DSM 21527]